MFLNFIYSTPSSLEMAYKQILYDTMRPLSTDVYMSIFLVDDCRQLYESLGESRYRKFLRFLVQELCLNVKNNEGLQRNSDHLLYIEGKTKYHLEKCLAPCQLKRFFALEHTYVFDDNLLFPINHNAPPIDYEYSQG
jgi:hypothetical protein